ncbi:hypothetical protein FB45DRAFT_1028590 [Roridomyces roridus]|uniref:Uncharacterized protein n=1 Tax=Roridomyces roridus TaxID=1738132 RepID=A0AAD7BRH6_9AGAR|nr:hypothetical protein FB45DRAFT_1028590 [Roridomyces roridus]
MIPPELVELIVRHGWRCLSTSSHRHAYSMTSWMLVSREWLSIVIPIFLCDVWATSPSLMFHLFDNCRSTGLAFRLAGITDVKQYLAQNCRSLTVSIYQRRTDEYDRQCAELADYVADPTRKYIVAGLWTLRAPFYGIPPGKIRAVINDRMPNITSLHFVFVDCLPTFWYWDMEHDFQVHNIWEEQYPDCLSDVYITFAYTCPPPPLLVGAPRGTYFPPRNSFNLPRFLDFTSVKRLVVREATADFIAFLATKCPQLECIESTAQFGAEDLPPDVAARVGDRMVFRRLAPTTDWGIKGSDIPGVQPLISSARKADPPPPVSKEEPPPAPKQDPPPVPKEHPPVPEASPPLIPKADPPLAPKEDPPVPKASPPPTSNEDAESPQFPKRKKPLFWRIVRRVVFKRT